VACGWLAAPQGNQVRFFRAIQEALARGSHLLFTHEGRLQTLFDKALTDVAHRIAMTVEGLGHVRIRPVGAIGIYVAQDMGMLNLRGRSLPALGQLYECLSFVVCEAHNIGLVHVESSIFMVCQRAHTSMPQGFHRGGEKNTLLSVAGLCGPTSGEIRRKAAYGGACSAHDSMHEHIARGTQMRSSSR
jgi:hypothetical protein